MDSSSRLEEIRIGDIESLHLKYSPSRTNIIRVQKPIKFFNKVLISILIILLVATGIIVPLIPYIKQIKEMMVREMSEQNGNLGLNQNYARVNPKDKNYVYIPIVGTDDIHGNFFPKVNHIKVNGEDLTYKTGGLEFVAKYINILREEFGAHRVLYFDGGDFYQGGMASVLFDGEIMQDFFNLIGLNGSTIGNHEFDYSRSWIESKINRAKYKTLVHNIRDNTTNKKIGALGKNHERSYLYKIKLENNDEIRIGVIGLTFNMKNDKKMPNTWGNRETWDNLQFFSYMTELEEESKRLRKSGANAVIALTHFGLVCNQTQAMKLDMYNKSSIQGECYRDDEDSVLYKLLDIIKPGVLDGIIGGDTHMEMHHWEKNIPMMSVPTHARYLNIMYLPFKKNENGKYILVNDDIKIEGPLPACEKIFKNSQNCELISSKEYSQVGELINYSWHGKKIEKDKIVQPLYDKYYKKYQEYAEQSIVTFEGFDKIKVDKSGDCILCNTYLDAIADIKKADFAIINRGIFPEELVPSTLTREDFYNQMPYLDKICTVDVTGEELKKIVSTVQSVGKNFYPSSNLKQSLKIDKDGKKEMVNVELYVNGEAKTIENNKIYKMASSLYVLSETSGEDFAKGESYDIIHKKAIEKKVTCSTKTIDAEMAEYFKGKGTVDLSKKVDPKKPRILIVE
jgi:2',3'-cyclic-nucleotide 2'-phosphodiesterase (5'-nucleotidase family)